MTARKVRRKRCQEGMRLQSVLFSKTAFPRTDQAKKWCKKHGLRYSKVHTTVGYHRIRQENPKNFDRKSFRIIEFKPGAIKAIIGCPRRARKR
jgi:hypothetical protein